MVTPSYCVLAGAPGSDPGAYASSHQVSRSPSLELTKLDALSEGWPFATDCRANWNPFWYQPLAGLLLPLMLLAALVLSLVALPPLAALPLLQPAIASRHRIPVRAILVCTISSISNNNSRSADSVGRWAAMPPTTVLTRYGSIRLTAELLRFELRAAVIATAAPRRGRPGRARTPVACAAGTTARSAVALILTPGSRKCSPTSRQRAYCHDTRLVSAPSGEKPPTFLVSSEPASRGRLSCRTQRAST